MVNTFELSNVALIVELEVLHPGCLYLNVSVSLLNPLHPVYTRKKPRQMIGFTGRCFPRTTPLQP